MKSSLLLLTILSITLIGCDTKPNDNIIVKYAALNSDPIYETPFSHLWGKSASQIQEISNSKKSQYRDLSIFFVGTKEIFGTKCELVYYIHNNKCVGTSYWFRGTDDGLNNLFHEVKASLISKYGKDYDEGGIKLSLFSDYALEWNVGNTYVSLFYDNEGNISVRYSSKIHWDDYYKNTPL